MTIRIPRHNLPWTFAPAFSFHRGSDRRRRAWRHGDALSQPRRRPAADHPWRAIRRRRRRWRRGVGACRPAVANDGRGCHLGIVRQCAGFAAGRSVARERFHREDAAGKSPGRAGHFLSRQVPRPFTYRRCQRAGDRPLPHRAQRPARCQLCLGRRCRGTRLGHQSRRWRHGHLRHHAQAPDRISCCIPATPSMPTASLLPR